MLLKVELFPPGKETDLILSAWQNAWSLDLMEDGRFKMYGHDPLEVITDLRNRCYDNGSTVEISYEDL